MADKQIVVNFEDAKRGLGIPKSPQYRAYTRIKRILEEEACVLVINSGLEQVAPNMYRLYASPEIKETVDVGDETL